MSLSQQAIRELLEVLDPEFARGERRIYCYRPPGEPAPVKDFLEHHIDKSAQASYATLFRRYCCGHFLRGETHRVWPENKYKGCEGLGEYKHIGSKSRIVHVTVPGHVHILLFGFTGKNENKTDQVHVNRAMNMRDEFRRRLAEVDARAKKNTS